MSKITGQNGIILFGASAAITGASGTTTITVLSATHTFVAKDRIKISDVVGMTDINGFHTVVSVVAGVSFTIAISATAQTWSSGGTAQKCVDITEFSLELKSEVANITDSSNSASGYKSFLPKGWIEGSGTISGFMQSGANKPTLATAVIITLRLDDSNYYSGTGYLISDGNSLSVVGTDAVKVTFGFQMSGTITQTVA